MCIDYHVWSDIHIYTYMIGYMNITLVEMRWIMDWMDLIVFIGIIIIIIMIS